MDFREYWFFVTSEAIRQWFSRVTKSLVKMIAELPDSWQKTVFTVTHTSFYILPAVTSVVSVAENLSRMDSTVG